jgi:hypothetical protein
MFKEIEFNIMNDVIKAFVKNNYTTNEEFLSSDLNHYVFLIKNNQLVRDFKLQLDLSTDEAEQLNQQLKNEDMEKEWITKNILPLCIEIGKECRKSNIDKIIFSVISEGTLFNKEERKKMSEIDIMLSSPECIPGGKFDLLHEFHVIDFNKNKINVTPIMINIDKRTYKKIDDFDSDSCETKEFSNAFIKGYQS